MVLSDSKMWRWSWSEEGIGKPKEVSTSRSGKLPTCPWGEAWEVFSQAVSGCAGFSLSKQDRRVCEQRLSPSELEALRRDTMKTVGLKFYKVGNEDHVLYFKENGEWVEGGQRPPGLSLSFNLPVGVHRQHKPRLPRTAGAVGLGPLPGVVLAKSQEQDHHPVSPEWAGSSQRVQSWALSQEGNYLPGFGLLGVHHFFLPFFPSLWNWAVYHIPSHLCTVIQQGEESVGRHDRGLRVLPRAPQSSLTFTGCASLWTVAQETKWEIPWSEGS